MGIFDKCPSRWKKKKVVGTETMPDLFHDMYPNDQRSLRGKILAFADTMLQVACNNKVAHRIFRSQVAVQRERIRQRQENRYIIHPFSQFRWNWDLIMVFTLAFTLLLLPVEIAFYSQDGETSTTWMSINILVDLIFLIDILFNFRTGYLLDEVDQVEIGSRLVAMQYLKTWFFVDFISSIPFDYLYKGFNDEFGETGSSVSFYLTLRILRFTKLLSLLRILRVARLVRYIYKIEELLEMEGKIISMLNLVGVILVFCHWNGCLQYLAAFLEGFPEECWVRSENLHPVVDDVVFTNSTMTWRLYTRSLYRAMSHMLCIGYGLYPPITTTDTWMVILSMTLGASFYALFIAHMSGLILSLDLSGKKYDEMIAEVKQYLRFRRVPITLQQKVLEYYDHKYQRKYFDEPRILYDPTNLSHTLREDILMHNCAPLVAKVPFLSSAPPDFLYDIICKLEFQVFFPKDFIIYAGKKGDSMYFVEHGLVEVQLPNGKIVNSLGDGSYFGEIALLLDERRVASVIAVEICDVYCLRKADFDVVLEEYPQMKMVLERIAKQRMCELSDTDKSGNEASNVVLTKTESGAQPQTGINPTVPESFHHPAIE